MRSAATRAPCCVPSPRTQFLLLVSAEMRSVRIRALRATLAELGRPRVLDLLELLSDDCCPLDEADPLTLGDLVGCDGQGPRVADWLISLDLPLLDPLAGEPDDALLELTIAEVLAACS